MKLTGDFMKTLTALLVTVISAAASTGLSCQQEAQIIASVSTVAQTSSTSCQVTVDSVQQFNQSYVCPLFIGDIGSGIEVGTNLNGKCAFSPGEIISGILYRNSAGVILLE